MNRYSKLTSTGLITKINNSKVDPKSTVESIEIEKLIYPKIPQIISTGSEGYKASQSDFINTQIYQTKTRLDSFKFFTFLRLSSTFLFQK